MNREYGTYPVRLNARGRRDPLFAGIDDEFLAQCAHHDRIVELPSDAVVLASSERCPVQAFGILGFGIYGVQFHPERTKAGYMARLAHKRKGGLEDPVELASIEAKLKDSPLAERVVRNFIDHHVRPCRMIKA
jgi:GMP synthase (glutamine-hydrolysing)